LTREELTRRIEAVEEGYEFFLAYAAQGLTADAATASVEQLRRFLGRMDEALDGLGEGFAEACAAQSVEPADAAATLVDAVTRDAETTRAAVRILRQMRGVSSQLIENFNISVHVRALLTDLFLLDELLE
jgi:hypothetical protein